MNFEFRISNEELRRAAGFSIRNSKFDILNSSARSPHPPLRGTFYRGRRLLPRLAARFGLQYDAELRHPPIERLPADSQSLGGSRNAAAGLQKRAFDLLFFHRHIARLATGDVETEVIAGDDVAGRNQRCPRDPILQLADVSRPVVGKQRCPRVIVELLLSASEGLRMRQDNLAAFAQWL